MGHYRRDKWSYCDRHLIGYVKRKTAMKELGIRTIRDRILRSYNDDYERTDEVSNPQIKDTVKYQLMQDGKRPYRGYLIIIIK